MYRCLCLILVTALATLGFGLTRAGGSTGAQSCAGYPVSLPALVVPLPRHTKATRVRLDASGTMGTIVSGASGGDLYIDCRDGLHYRALRSTRVLEVRPPVAERGWASIFVPWEGDRAVLIDGKLFRFDQLPFASAAPADFLIERAQGTYSLPFRWCASLRLHAPLYGLDPETPGDLTSGVRRIRLALRERTYALEAQQQEEYNFGALDRVDLNGDGLADLFLRYEERLGSGRQGYAALLLNCGDGQHALAGLVGLGAAGASVPAPAVSTRSICGREMTTLSVQHLGREDSAVTPLGASLRHDLYAYSPASRRFVMVGSSPNPFPVQVAPANSCPAFLRSVDASILSE